MAKVISLLFAVFLILFSNFRSAIAQDEMDLFAADGKNPKAARLAWTKHKRFERNEPSPTFESLQEQAKRYWTWVKDQPGSQPEECARLVAVLYIHDDNPSERQWFASTIPRGDYKAAMMLKANNGRNLPPASESAPAWWSQIYTGQLKTDIDAQSPMVQFHAEDGAYYYFESSIQNKLPPNGRYPDHSWVAIYGDFWNAKNPGPVPPCGAGDKSRKPNCLEIAKALNVQTKSGKEMVPIPDNAVYDYDETSSFEEEMDQIANEFCKNDGNVKRQDKGYCDIFPVLMTTVDTPSALPKSTSTSSKDAMKTKTTSVTKESDTPRVTAKPPPSPTASVGVQVGSSPVLVGTVTSNALYTSVSKALETLCPPVTQTKYPTNCSIDTAYIENIPYVEEDGSLDFGSVGVTVDYSSYNVTSLRDAMIKTSALAVQKAAVGKNCWRESYEQSISDRSIGGGNGRNSSSGNSWLFPGSRLQRRGEFQDPEPREITLCNTIGFTNVEYYSPWGRGPSDQLSVSYAFHLAAGDFICELLELAVDAFSAVEPEFTVDDIRLGEEIKALCEEAASASQ